MIKLCDKTAISCKLEKIQREVIVYFTKILLQNLKKSKENRKNP
jgi:hypothetical protein